MTVNVTTLSNDLRVATHDMPHLATASLGVWVRCGARYERADLNGISHLLEHMAFKGTERRSALRIAEEIETVGGDLNAGTSLETTAYYARVLKDDVGLALDILGDILQNSTFAPDELDRERDVIIQEIAATNDIPDEVAFDLAQACAFPDQSIGRPILGTVDTVNAIARTDLTTYLAEHYRAGDMVICAAGRVDHDQVVAHSERIFSGLKAGPGDIAPAARYVGGTVDLAGPNEQAHVILAFESPALGTDAYFHAQVLAGLLGGGMSSRLFQEIREKRGLCYSIYAFASGFQDTGLFGIHAATGAEQVRELVDLTADELRAIATTGPTIAELARAKAQLKAGIAMILESSSARAEQLARQLLIHGQPIDVARLTQRVDDVSVEDIRVLAASIAGSPPTLTHLGPVQVGVHADQVAARLSAG